MGGALLLVMLLFLMPPVAASAAEDPSGYVSDLYEGLPSLSREMLPPSPEDTGALLETVGVRHLFEVLLSGLQKSAPPLLGSALSLLGMTLLFALLRPVRDGLGAGTARGCEAVLGVALVLSVWEHFSGCFTRAASYLADLSALSEVAAPAFGGLYLAGGNAGAAAASGGAMAALSLLLEYLAGAALLPLLRTMLGFLLVSAVGEVKTEGLVSSLRTLYVTVMGFFSVLIAAALALGNALGSAGDSYTLRTMRFAVGQMVPIVGGTVAGALGTAAASVTLLRGTAGVTVAAAVLLPLLPVVAELLLVRLLLGLLSSVAGLLGAAAPGRLFRSFRSLFDLVLAATAMAGLLFLFLAATLARTAPAVR